MIDTKDICFTVCCKSSKDNVMIYACVESILSIYPDITIIIVDSCSDNRNYMLEYKDRANIFIEDVGNKNYEYGAIVHAFKKYRDKYKTFVFLQDSMLLENEISELEDLGNNYLVFKEEKSGWLCEGAGYDYFYKLHRDFPQLEKNNFQIAIWNSFAINTDTFNCAINSELFCRIQPPINKVGSEYMERVWSILFSNTSIGYKINKTSIKKIFARRQ